MTCDQSGFDVRCEWGVRGMRALAAQCDVAIVVDVLSFTTCVDIAIARGAEVYPYRWRDYSARQWAESINAHLALPRDTGAFSLSPASLEALEEGASLVLPSPNGATVALAAGEETPLFAGCLRNAAAVARAAQARGMRVAVIPAGERWADGTLRPCLEDWLGAGAIIAELKGKRSPEARCAADAFAAIDGDLFDRIAESGSGRELIERGYERDVELASELRVSDTTPWLRDGRFIDSSIEEIGLLD